MGRGVGTRDRVREEGRGKEEVRGGEHSEVSEGGPGGQETETQQNGGWRDEEAGVQAQRGGAGWSPGRAMSDWGGTNSTRRGRAQGLARGTAVECSSH